MLRRCWRRQFSSGNGQGVLRLKLDSSPQVCGISSTRGTRAYNEDRFQRKSIRLGNREALYFAVFDGHGGSQASEYCARHLHEHIERVYKAAWDASGHGSSNSDPQQAIETCITQAFRQVDEAFLATHPQDATDGTTASIVILQSLDVATTLMTVGHVGDSRIVMCDNVTGKAQPLTIDHHPQIMDERRRIEKAGGFVSTDSFGQMAIMGLLGTSRSIGVPRIKHRNKDIVIAVPQVCSRILDANDAFLVLCTDGVHSIMSNQEIADVVKHCTDPTTAAAALVDISERYGTQDNSTAMVVRLEGWPMGQTPPPTRDYTQNLRRFKLRHSSTGGRGGVDIGVEYNPFDDDDDDETPTATQHPQTALVKPLERHHLRELRYDRFVVDLFDETGKDIGRTDMFSPCSHDQSSDRYDFRNGSMGTKNIGRLTAQEIRDGISTMDVAFRKSEPGLLKREVSGDEVVELLFSTVGSSTDVDPVDDPTGESSDRYYHARKRDALSAADIKRGLESMNIKVFSRIK